MSRKYFSPRTDTVYVDELEVNERRPSPMAIIYRSEFDYISRCILDYPDIETGGQLFGFWTGTGIPVVLYAIGPGRNANHQVSFFNQDVDYLTAIGKKLIDTYALQHIGEWHSHHRLGLASPSGHDASTMINSISDLGLRRFLLCIGNCDRSSSTLNAFNFHESDLRNYVQAAWSITELESPFRPLIDRQLADILEHPHTRNARHGDNFLAVERPKISQPTYTQGYWLRDKANNLQLKEIIDYVSYATGSTPAVRLDGRGHVSVTVDMADGEQFYADFPDGFPTEAPEIYVPESMRVKAAHVPDGSVFTAPLARDVWPAEGSISERFIACVQCMCGLLPPPIGESEEPVGTRHAASASAVTTDMVKKHLLSH